MQTGILSLVRGDDQEIGITVNNSDGTPYNLSGSSLILTARGSEYFSDIIFQSSGDSHISPESGISEIALSSTVTASGGNKKYYFDVKLLDTGNKITTLMAGDLLFYPRP